jgi:osmoprotectant transport system ATP-binding protein
MITVRHLSKRFGKLKAVDDITFTVPEGENLMLLGASGCGKTTTLRMLNRLIEPDEGEITISGQDIATIKPETLRRGIGYVLQHNSLLPHYTVAENIAIVPQLLQWSKQKIALRVDELLHKMHLEPGRYARCYPHQLSGGQQQRVNIARALAANPPILLMDEPFGALDTITKTSIRNEFKELDELKRKTIVMVTHDVQEAFELGNCICLMHEGKIAQYGGPLDLLLQPATSYVRDFFKDSYLQLLLQASTINDIWPNLESAGSVIDHAPVLSAHDNLWQLMEVMLGQGTAQYYSICNDKGEQKIISKAALLNEITAIGDRTH